MVEMSISEGETHVWYLLTEKIATHTHPAFVPLLVGSELEKHHRLKLEKVRTEHLLTRALCRLTLSKYFDVLPTAWCFERNAWGRPRITHHDGLAGFDFNLSHTQGLITCLITRNIEAGVDVENLARRGETVAIAKHYFAPSEVHALNQVPENQKRERFFQYWTLKESYIKARGMGLQIPLDQFSFELDIPGPIRIQFGPQIEDNPAAWQFEINRLSAQHLAAIGLKRGLGKHDHKVSYFETTLEELPGRI